MRLSMMLHVYLHMTSHKLIYLHPNNKRALNLTCLLECGPPCAVPATPCLNMSSVSIMPLKCPKRRA